jgi:hypothetical protein
MKHKIQMSDAERLLLKEALEEVSARAKYPVSLDRLLNTWSAFVRDLERGFESNIYDYSNSLGSRDLLDEILRRLPADLRITIHEVLDPWDERFDKATRPTDRPISPGAEERSTRWLRVPKILREELRRDLDAGTDG